MSPIEKFRHPITTSPESRAIARALLLQRRMPALSRSDADALLVYSLIHWFTARTDPDYRTVESSATYRRGSEIASAKESCAPDDAKPNALDLESKERRERLLEMLQEAWERQLPEYRFPFMKKNGRIYFRVRPSASRFAWSIVRNGEVWEELYPESGCSKNPLPEGSPNH